MAEEVRMSVTIEDGISGPMKKAVMIVPTPAMVGMAPGLPPASRNSTQPLTTQTTSVAMRQYWKGAIFHLPDRAIAIAS